MKRSDSVRQNKDSKFQLDLLQVQLESMEEVTHALHFVRAITQGWPEIADSIATAQLAKQLRQQDQESVSNLTGAGSATHRCISILSKYE